MEARARKQAVENVQFVSAQKQRWYLNLTLWVASLGYFIDMYDYATYGNNRVSSLKALGVIDPAKIMSIGMWINNWQTTGLIVGGLITGILGDKLGRKSVLFGSILLYSLASLASAFVTDVNTYCVLRTLGGLGLAGEVGVAVTLVNEILSTEIRGWATSVLAAIGISGFLAAAIASLVLNWRTCFAIGGVAGLLLLVLRMRVVESGMFDRVKSANVPRGRFLMLLKPKRIGIYLACIAAAAPMYFIAGLFVPYAPEFARAIGIKQTVTVGSVAIVATIGTGIGDLLSGFISQVLGNRKKVVGAAILIMSVLTAVCLFAVGHNIRLFYAVMFALGVAGGYYAVYATMVAEQFGTNLRSTATTSVTNFARGTAIVIRLAFVGLLAWFSSTRGAAVVAGVCIALALLSLLIVRETYGKSLDYLEE